MRPSDARRAHNELGDHTETDALASMAVNTIENRGSRAPSCVVAHHQVMLSPT